VILKVILPILSVIVQLLEFSANISAGISYNMAMRQGLERTCQLPTRILEILNLYNQARFPYLNFGLGLIGLMGQ